MTKISIITTSYNHKDFIGYTIQSILDQTFSDRELLIGDDSPGNETWETIEWYVKKNPKKIKARHNTPNKWIAENMNFLISKICPESEYIAFLEGDDMRDKDYLKDKLEVFTKYPEAKLVYNNFNFIDKNNTVIQKDIFGFRWIKTYQNEKITADDYVLANVWPIISWSTFMIHKDMIEKYHIRSLDPKNKVCSTSEYDFWLQVATHHNVYYMNQTLTLYRRHENNLSRSNPNLMKELSDLIKYYHKNHIISDNAYNIKLSHNNLVQSLIYLENGDKKKSLHHWKDAISYNRFNYIIMKLWIVFLLILPLNRSKRILSKLIKRG